MQQKFLNSTDQYTVDIEVDFMSHIIDARGLSCPQPVILTKKAMDEWDADCLTTIVDQSAALENVRKLAQSQGYDVEVEEKAGEYHITMVRPTDIESSGDDQQDDVAILITNRYFGQGDEELGKILMRSFLYTLNEMNGRVKNIIFMNSGVFLTTKGSEVLEILQGLVQEGSEVLSCGTCLDFYGLKDKLAVGSVTNMYTAAEILSRASHSITL